MTADIDKLLEERAQHIPDDCDPSDCDYVKALLQACDAAPDGGLLEEVVGLRATVERYSREAVDLMAQLSQLREELAFAKEQLAITLVEMATGEEFVVGDGPVTDEEDDDDEAAASLPAIEEEHADLVAGIKAMPVEPAPPGWQERVWGRIAVSEAKQAAKGLERLRVIRDAGFAYVDAHDRFQTVNPTNDRRMVEASTAVNNAEEHLRKLLRAEHKVAVAARAADKPRKERS